MKNGEVECDLTIEERLSMLREKGQGVFLSIEDILRILSDKGQLLMILFLALPFCQPIQLPGLSTPFGLAIAFIGIETAFNTATLLPRKILEMKISPDTLQAMSDTMLRLLKKMHRYIKPRIAGLFDYRFMHIANGLLISFLGLLLALPLPTPFSNLLAAWSIVLTGIGMSNKDGLFLLIGYVCSTVTLGYLAGTVILITRIWS